MAANDMGTLADNVRLEAALLEPAAGTHLPKLHVEAQLRFAERSEFELLQELAHLVVAVALRKPSTTPKELLKSMHDNYRISDEVWYERVSPELRRVLASNGFIFEV